MHAVMRKYRFNAADSKELNRKIKEGFVPLVRKVPGFVANYWFDIDNGEGALLSVFEDKARAGESVRVAADFLRKELSSILGSQKYFKELWRPMAD
jgi:hypothetical protein